jgi:hypothetical protein
MATMTPTRRKPSSEGRWGGWEEAGRDGGGVGIGEFTLGGSLFGRVGCRSNGLDKHSLGG